MSRIMSYTGTMTHGRRRGCRWPIAHTGTVVAAYAGTMATAHARMLAATNGRAFMIAAAGTVAESRTIAGRTVIVMIATYRGTAIA